jgi:hypothetical protein
MSARREIISAPQHAGLMASAAASEVVRGGDFLFVSGLTAIDPHPACARPGPRRVKHGRF